MDRVSFDLATTPLREINAFLHRAPAETESRTVILDRPGGVHNLAVGMAHDWRVTVHGHVGYYAAGMNQTAEMEIFGNAGTGLAENMMSGRVVVHGFASNAAGASAHGGLLVIGGDAGLRCGISLKGGDIVVGGSVGSFSGFMAQAGRLLVCGDAGDALGDSLYETVIYLGGHARSLGADAREEPMTEPDYQEVESLLARAGGNFCTVDPGRFRKIVSARSLYHWNANANQEY